MHRGSSRVEQRDPVGRLRRRGARRPEPVVAGAREPEPPLQLLHPRLGRGDLDPADAVPAGLAVDVERRVERHGFLRDPAHHARPVRLEREAGRMRGRAPASNSGPWSSTRTSASPSSARWEAADAPTIPAPTTTVLARSRIRRYPTLTTIVLSSVRRSIEKRLPTRPTPLAEPARPPNGRCDSQ